MAETNTSEIFNFSGKVLLKVSESDIKIVHLNNPNNTMGTYINIPKELDTDLEIGTKVSGTVKVTHGQGLMEDDIIQVQSIDIT